VRRNLQAEEIEKMIIDTHTHLFDTTRPEGVPWPPPDDEFLYRRTMPDDYKAVAEPVGTTGTIVVEASSWVEDNQWILDMAENDPMLIGLVGHLEPPSEAFENDLNRFAAHPLFYGIRLGTVDRNDRQCLAACEQLMALDLELDLLVGPELLEEVAWIAGQFPALRIVLNHVAQVPINGQAPDALWLQGMKAAAANELVFCKVSGLVELTGEKTPPESVDYYRPVLDALWHAFGRERLVYGSNWPVSARYADYAAVQHLAEAYFEPMGKEIYENVMWKNSQKAYDWKERD